MTQSRIDFSQFTHGDKAQRIRAARELLHGLAKYGHAELIGHGIADETVDSAFEMVRSHNNAHRSAPWLVLLTKPAPKSEQRAVQVEPCRALDMRKPAWTDASTWLQPRRG